MSERAGTYISEMEHAGVYRVTRGAHTSALIVTPRVDGESNLTAQELPESPSNGRTAAIGDLWDASGVLLVLALALLAFEWRLRTDGAGRAL
jgi:hypothetical protein